MARLFTAVELGALARAAVVARQAVLVGRLREAGDVSLRPVRPEHLHLTVVFLGEVADARVPDAVTALSEPLAQRAFDVAFGSAGAFPPTGPMRVLWLGVEQGSEGLRAVHAELASRVRRLGIALEPRPFAPHLTLARWRVPAPSTLRPVLDGGQSAHRIIQPVAAVTLFRSHLRAGGPEHVPLARAPLA